MQPILKRDYKVTWHNIFTCFDLALHLADQKCCIVGTVLQNKRELPEDAKAKKQHYETTLFTSSQTASAAMI